VEDVIHLLAGELLTIPEFFRHHDRESRPKLSNSATVMATEVTALSRKAANRQSTAFTRGELVELAETLLRTH
jgi:hypothetical protein